MRYKHFKNADVDVSELAVGTWAIGGDNYGPVDREASIQAIRTMIDNGVNLVDTAPCYGNGYSEKVVGEALAGGYRDKVLISTKVGLVTSANGYDRDSSFKNIMREVESSLYNLKTDHIDFYFVHWPDAHTPFAETMSALELLRKQGKIRFIGVSNFTKEMIEECEKYGKVDVQQPPFSMVDRTYVDLMQWGAARGIDSMTYGSMGAGILSGKYRTTPDFPEGDTRLTFYDYFREPKFSKVQELLKVMDEVAEAHGKPVGQVALNWSTQKDYVGCALVGVRSDAHAIENCAAYDWSLTDDEIAKLDAKLDELGL
ncbi:aldo/keto reductase [uncultured Enorma sp.]|uniref:aldo/keto reductase n=1 Tax=uncultured Enorma sp. TaxID=1714346 RepID=UPI0025956F2A|nr:aldo/keto reductase [uncultured Enorma sp.]